MLFKYSVENANDWGKVFCRADAFDALIAEICRIHGFERGMPGECAPGTNAVFAEGGRIFKIFAPDESRLGGESDYLTELYGIRHALERGAPVPRILASGSIKDRYLFRYIVSERLYGFSPDIEAASAEEMTAYGEQLGGTLALLNTPCEPFNGVDYLRKALSCGNWAGFPDSFRADRLERLRGLEFSPAVFVHGDLNADNVIDEDGRLYMIDFADALAAPVEYEYAALIPSMGGMRGSFLRGFFGEYDEQSVAALLTRGLLLHSFGRNIILDHIAPPESISGVAGLEKAILAALEKRREK